MISAIYVSSHPNILSMINCGIMITMAGTIMLDKKQRKHKVRPLKGILANANAAIALKKTCPHTTTAVTKMEFKKYRPKDALFQAAAKFSKVTLEGNIVGG